MTGFKNVINCKNNVINKIAQSKEIMGLIFDDPDIDMNGASVKNILYNNIFNYGFSGNTFSAEKTAVFIESKVNAITESVKNISIIIQIVSPNSYIKLNGEELNNKNCNRNDNIAVAISDLLDDFDCGSIGGLNLEECSPDISSGTFSSLKMIFTTKDFR